MKKTMLLFASACSLVVNNLSDSVKSPHGLVPLIPRAVLFGNSDKDQVRISPDGTKLAYRAPVAAGGSALWIKTIGHNDDHPLKLQGRRGGGRFFWAYDNQHLLFLQDTEGDECLHLYRVDIASLEVVDLTPFEKTVVTLYSYSKGKMLIGLNKENKKFFDAYTLDTLTGELELVMKNPGTSGTTGTIETWCADADLCVRAAVVVRPDGSKLLLTRQNDRSDWEEAIYWDTDDSLPGSDGPMPIGFSHDGSYIYVLDTAGTNTKRLVKLHLVTGKKTVVAADDDYDIDRVVMDIHTNEPVLVSWVRERRCWKSLIPEMEKDLAFVLASNNGDLISVNPSADSRRWVVGFTNVDQPVSFYLYDRNTQKIEHLFYSYSELLNYRLAPMQPIVFTARDGLLIHGYLTCPLGVSPRQLPLILCVHGGPWNRDIWEFNPTAQWFANRGYACLQVNFRGSTGYGKQFCNAGDKQWGGKMHDDVIDAVNWALKQGIADAKRVAIFGRSYGGYAALIGAAFTPDTFCCAVDCNGPVNLITLLQTIPSFWETQRACFYKRIGNPETETAFLNACSPLSKVDRIKIPILIAQGANDPRVNRAEAEQIVAALRSHGLPYEYMLFPHEGHNLGRKENRLKFFAAAERFLAKHLGGRVEE